SQRDPRIPQACIMFALLGIVCLLRQRGTPGGRFPCGLALRPHLVLSISTSSPSRGRYSEMRRPLLPQSHSGLVAGTAGSAGLLAVREAHPRLSASQVLGLASQTAGLLLRQTLETISAPPNSLGAVGPSFRSEEPLAPPNPAGPFRCVMSMTVGALIPRFAASDCLRDDSVVASRVAFAVPCTPLPSFVRALLFDLLAAELVY